MLEIPTIRKSTFKVEGVKPYFKNCFISPSGKVIEIKDDWHHIEIAINIINDTDERNRKEITQLEQDIKMKRNYSFYTLKEKQERLDELKEINIKEDFNAVNRNRGFDAAEFLIIYHGYIALSDFFIVYLSTTRKQRELLNIVSDKDTNGKEILKPLNDKQLAFKSKRAEIIWQMSMAIENYNYYTDDLNAFHCPSGIPRMGWDSHKRNAIEAYSRISSEEYKKKISKYGLQFPRVNRERFGGRTYKKIDKNSFFIPGVNRELYEERNR